MVSQGPALIPYRENGQVKYAPAPPEMQNQSSNYDSDGEPLIPVSSHTELDENDIQHFTATGRPLPSFKSSGLANLGGGMYTAPQLLPTRYTDDSIIPAIVIDILPSAKLGDDEAIPSIPRKTSFLSKLKPDKSPKAGSTTKVVYMPRREYQKYFARGLSGEYIGSEPYRQWTLEELEETYGQYKPAAKPGRKSSKG